MVHAAYVLSTVAVADIVSVGKSNDWLMTFVLHRSLTDFFLDPSAALAAPGVIAYINASDIPKV